MPSPPHLHDNIFSLLKYCALFEQQLDECVVIDAFGSQKPAPKEPSS